MDNQLSKCCGAEIIEPDYNAGVPQCIKCGHKYPEIEKIKIDLMMTLPLSEFNRQINEAKVEGMKLAATSIRDSKWANKEIKEFINGYLSVLTVDNV